MENKTNLLEGQDVGDLGTRRRSIDEKTLIPNAAIFLKRTAIEFLQIIFSQRAEDSLHYDPVDSQTDIQISDMHAVSLETIGLRPAIVCVRGPMTWQGQGIGSVEKRSMTTGNQTFSDLLTGSVAFSCISREGIEAEQIAHLVFNSFKFFRPVLQQYGYFTIKSLNIGEEQLIEQEGADDRTTVVPVFVTAQIQDRWTLSSNVERKLRQIIVTTLFTP